MKEIETKGADSHVSLAPVSNPHPLLRTWISHVYASCTTLFLISLAQQKSLWASIISGLTLAFPHSIDKSQRIVPSIDKGGPDRVDLNFIQAPRESNGFVVEIYDL